MHACNNTAHLEKSQSPAPLTPVSLVVHPSGYDSVGGPPETIIHS
jgi:hypothetical protein